MIFGPPVAWLAGSALLLAFYPVLAGGLGPLLFGCGMVGAVALGGWLGRLSSRELSEALAVSLAPGGSDASAELQQSFNRASTEPQTEHRQSK
jgi:hypothetical protein